MATLPPSYSLSSDPSTAQTHLQVVFTALQTHPGIYWGKSRTFEVISRQLERAWSCVCVLKTTEEGEELVGFARVISDGEGFGYLCDVFVLPGHQKLGLATALVKEAVDNTGGPGASKGWMWFLWTKDAHPLYESAVGFKKPTNGWAMERFPPGVSDPA